MAYSIHTAMKSNPEFEKETGGIDMCNAMEEKEKRDDISCVIECMQRVCLPEHIIIKTVKERYEVTEEYVLAIMKELDA